MVRVIESGSWTWMVGSWWCGICARAKVVRNWLYARMDGGVAMRTTRRSSLPRCVRGDWLYARTDGGVTMRTTRRSSLPRCVRGDWLYARMDRGVEMRTTRRSSLPRYVRSDWLYARMDRTQGYNDGINPLVRLQCGRRGGRPSRAMWVATGFMPGRMAGLQCGRRGGRPSRALVDLTEQL
jgi:hypothetical protein